ncbi:YggT family protein [Pseudalkalibacillus caeni]|uniref:YggT family protein n=1 Tax=Exobacillus caeni TaxID=2574798 RepID=A0A5R9F1D7_9BACL|nr:YggT family protein [Pseudalkalibacillus caeni]TLS35258.1 YggT family protein [Pseudalkalibacillus caeni]
MNIAVLLAEIINIYSWILIIYIFMSWVPNARESTFGQIMASICEPYLAPFRKFIPPLGMIDISPIVAIFALNFARYGVFAIFGMF